MDTLHIAILTLFAGLGATISGTVGLGGGVMLLAVMIAAGMSPATAVPIHALVQIASNSTRGIVLRQHVAWAPVLVFALAAAPFPWVGLALAKNLDADLIKIFMAAVIIYATWSPKQGIGRLPWIVAFICAGVIGGFLGVILGATGALMMPFFLRDDWSKEKVIGTEAVSQTYLHILKIIAFGSQGFDFNAYWTLVIPMALATILGTFIGRRLLSGLSEPIFRKGVQVLLTILALKMTIESGIHILHPPPS